MPARARKLPQARRSLQWWCWCPSRDPGVSRDQRCDWIREHLPPSYLPSGNFRSLRHSTGESLVNRQSKNSRSSSDWSAVGPWSELGPGCTDSDFQPHLILASGFRQQQSLLPMRNLYSWLLSLPMLNSSPNHPLPSKWQTTPLLTPLPPAPRTAVSRCCLH